MTPIELTRDAHGRLQLTTADGGVHAVVPVRAFPIAAPDEGIALVGGDGHELAWIERLANLPDATRRLVEEELASREFIPEIRRLRQVSTFALPSTWEVETDRGDTRFVLKGEEDIRRLGATTLLIGDSHGVQYLVRDLTRLDKTSRRLLDRFM
ncbi:cyanophycin metabolism-associated DUF1854 family protein [Thiobacillus sedimenti]|uniref:DUF1854 domain-containing protein n=1 Tax=Thiobacillus sedimenti TaxID=3110231 RepID=A0ABZ1CH94_9PROT|nr:DUF1854 domain-containing protein [Thiobacillus sp. SCUT-2]WRS38465.1 DUF1854 domain-containing protein [Thiobacillus sp. SCUT-2]